MFKVVYRKVLVIDKIWFRVRFKIICWDCYEKGYYIFLCLEVEEKENLEELN